MTRRQIKEWVVIPLIVGLFLLMVEYYSGLFIVRSTSASEPSDSVNSNTSPSNNNISPSYFHLNRGDGICVKEDARVWLDATVFRSDGSKDEHLRTLPPGTKVFIVSGPIEGRIKHDSFETGWWWQVSSIPGGSSIGWIWEGRMVECSKI